MGMLSIYTWRELYVEVEVASYYLSLSLKGDISQEHVIQENSQRPDSSWESVVLVVEYPLWGSIHLCT